MVKFKALSRSVRIPMQTSTDYGPPVFSSFLNANHIVRWNDFFSQNFLKIIVLKILQNIVNLCFKLNGGAINGLILTD